MQTHRSRPAVPSRCQAHSWNLQFSLLCEISRPISGTETQISKPISRVLEETVVRVALKSQAHQTCGLISVFFPPRLAPRTQRVFIIPHHHQSPHSPPPRRRVENIQFHRACCRGEGLQRQGRLAAALPTCTWLRLRKDGTGRNEETAKSILPKWGKQTFLAKLFQFFFP